jgi:hypothetical protein
MGAGAPALRPAPPTLPLRRPPSYPTQTAVAPQLSRTPPQTVGAVPPPRGAMAPQAASPPPMPYAAAPPVSLQPDAQTGADQEDVQVVRPPMPVR